MAPGFARALLAEFARRFDVTLQLLQAARHEVAADRFSAALTQLARQRGRPAGEGWVEVAATQTELCRVRSKNENLTLAHLNLHVRGARRRWMGKWASLIYSRSLSF